MITTNLCSLFNQTAALIRDINVGVLKRLYALVGLTLSAARGLEQENDSLGCLVAAPGVPETSEEEFAFGYKGRSRMI